MSKRSGLFAGTNKYDTAGNDDAGPCIQIAFPDFNAATAVPSKPNSARMASVC